MYVNDTTPLECIWTMGGNLYKHKKEHATSIQKKYKCLYLRIKLSTVLLRGDSATHLAMGPHPNPIQNQFQTGFRKGNIHSLLYIEKQKLKSVNVH